LYFLAQSNVTMVSYGTIYRPLVNGWLVGVILGDPVMGVTIGATINMMFIGFISAGGSLPSDIPMAGILGTALAISAGLDVDAALALAVPLGLLGAFTWVGRLTLDSFFNPLTEKIIEKNDSLKGLWIPTVILPQLFLFCITCVPVTIAAYFGSQVVVDFLGSVAGETGELHAVITHGFQRTENRIQILLGVLTGRINLIGNRTFFHSGRHLLDFLLSL
jgi:PTS system mannose-specific IIC component